MFKHSSLLLLFILASLLPTPAQARTYDVIDADLPFKFTVGQRTFRAGHYQFILVGPGIMAVRDRKQHMVASLVTRSTDGAELSPSTRLVFDGSKKTAQLQKIYLERSAQVLEVIGEQLAMPSTPAPGPPLTFGTSSFSQRNDGPRLRP